MSATTKAVARRLIDELINRGDMTVFDELVAPDYVDHAGADSREDYRRMLAATRDALSDLRMEVEAIVAEGDTVAVRLRAEAVHSGDFLGFPGTGKKITWTGMGWFRIVDGQLRERWNESDVYGIVEQIRGG